MSGPQRFRVEVEAMRVPVEADGEEQFMFGHGLLAGWFLAAGFDEWALVEGYGYSIMTLQGVRSARPGDWIVRGVTGGFYRCSPDEFAARYVPVDPFEAVHQIEFRDDGWTIAHPLAERVDGSLFDCVLSNWVGGDLGVRGRFVLLDDGTLGDRIEP